MSTMTVTGHILKHIWVQCEQMNWWPMETSTQNIHWGSHAQAKSAPGCPHIVLFIATHKHTVSATPWFNSSRTLSNCYWRCISANQNIWVRCLFSSAEAPAVASIRAFILKNLSLCGENRRDRLETACF